MEDTLCQVLCIQLTLEGCQLAGNQSRRRLAGLPERTSSTSGVTLTSRVTVGNTITAGEKVGAAKMATLVAATSDMKGL